MKCSSTLGRSRPYPANLCPLLGRVQFAGLGEDFGKSIGELIETMFRSAIRQRATEHLNGVLGEEPRIDDTFKPVRGEMVGALGWGARCRGCDRAM